MGRAGYARPICVHTDMVGGGDGAMGKMRADCVHMGGVYISLAGRAGALIVANLQGFGGGQML